MIIAGVLFINIAVAKTSFAQQPTAEPLVEVPNVFTPNGDGQNDWFKVRTENIADIQVYIYNRWGNLVYHFWGINGSWDGRTWPAGEVCEEGVYYCFVKAFPSEEGAQLTFSSTIHLKR